MFLAFPVPAYSEDLFVQSLSMPNQALSLSPAYLNPTLIGLKISPQDPLKMIFIFGSGQGELDQQKTKNISERLIRYFMAGITIPEKDLWVNLSPYEEERIVQENLSLTELGRDLLAQDYLLKQLTSSLMNPREELGRAFWDRIYDKVSSQLNGADIPINTFNKVWIVPEKAEIYQDGYAVYVTAAHLKVMLEEDYFAMEMSPQEQKGADRMSSQTHEGGESLRMSSETIREIILPAIEKEVNEGEHFVPLRQMYMSLILAKWYKTVLHGQFINYVYADQAKIEGIDVVSYETKDKIYQRYTQAFKKGVFNFVKEEYDAVSQEIIPRKYFSGGTVMKIPKFDLAYLSDVNRVLQEHAQVEEIDVDFAMLAGDVNKNYARSAPLKKIVEHIDTTEDYGAEALGPFFKSMSSDGSDVIFEQLAFERPDQRAEKFYQLLGAGKYRMREEDGQLSNLFFTEEIHSKEEMRAAVSSALRELLSPALTETSATQEIYQVLSKYNISRGWGRTYSQIRSNLAALDLVLSRHIEDDAEESDVREVKENIGALMARLPIDRSKRLDSTHGLFNQKFYMGGPDTGGQVVYLVEYARKLAEIIDEKFENSGIPKEKRIYPQILIVTRQIETNEYVKMLINKDAGVETEEDIRNIIKGNQELAAEYDRLVAQERGVPGSVEKETLETLREKVTANQTLEVEYNEAVSRWEENQHAEQVELLKDREGHVIENAVILRVPFRDKEQAVVSDFTERFYVWPYLARFAIESNEVVNEYLKNNDLPEEGLDIIGNYSDGTLVGMLVSLLRNNEGNPSQLIAIPHAIERSKARRIGGDGRPVYNEDQEKYMDIQFAGDRITMALASYIMGSSRQEQIEQFVHLVDGLIDTKEQWTLLKGLPGKFSIGALGVSEEIYDDEHPLPDALNKEYQWFKKFVTDLKGLRTEGNRSKNVAIEKLIKRIIRDLAPRYESVASEEDYEHLFIGISEEERQVKEPQIWFSIARLAPEKNLALMIREFLGTEGVRQNLIQFLNEQGLAPDYVSELKIVEQGGLPRRFLEREYLNLVAQPATGKSALSERLFRELTELRELRQNSIVFIVAGEGEGMSQDEKRLVREIGDLVRDNNLEDTVIRWTSLPSPQLLPIMKRVRANYVHPAISEPFGIAILEGFLTGISLVTDNAGATDLIRDDERFRRFIFNPLQEGGLAQAMRNVIDSSESERQDDRKLFRDVYELKAGWKNKARNTMSYLNLINVLHSAGEMRKRTIERNIQLSSMVEGLLKKIQERFAERDFATIPTNEEIDKITKKPLVSPEEGADNTPLGGVDLSQINLEQMNKDLNTEVEFTPQNVDLLPVMIRGLDFHINHIIPLANTPLLLGAKSKK